MSLRRESDFGHLEQLLREADERAKKERCEINEKQTRRLNRSKDACRKPERAEQEQKRADEEQQNRQEAEFRTQIEEMYLSAVREDAGCQNNCGEQIFN
jgi:hypothetical protein